MALNLPPGQIVFLILVFATAATGFQAMAGLARAAAMKRKVNRRLTLAERSGSLPELVFELRRQRGLNEAGERIARFGWLTDLVVKSGIVMKPKIWIAASAAAGVAVAGLVFMATRGLLLAL